MTNRVKVWPCHCPAPHERGARRMMEYAGREQTVSFEAGHCQPETDVQHFLW